MDTKTIANNPPAAGQAADRITREANRAARAIVSLIESSTGACIPMADCAKVVQCVGEAIRQAAAPSGFVTRMEEEALVLEKLAANLRAEEVNFTAALLEKSAANIRFALKVAKT